MLDAATAICRLLAPPDARTDGELLTAFRVARDEPAFTELLRQHGPMVLAACRRLLPDPADAEDAFQAAFLVLARRANRLGREPSVGPWLHRVAVLTARNLRRRNARRFARQSALPETISDSSPGPTAAELRIDLDAALLSLPEKLRVPLVLCHLQGWTRRDAAERLGCPEGTLSSLLARGLARLRRRFPTLDPAHTLVLPAVAVPAALANSTVQAASAAVAPPALLSITVSQLAEGVLRMFWVKKTTAALAALTVVFGLGMGVGVSVRQAPHAGANDPAAGNAAQPAPKTPAKPQDLTKRLAELRLQLALTEQDLMVARKGLELAAQKLEITEQLGNPDDIAKAREFHRSYYRKVVEAEALCGALRAKIAELEAKLKAEADDPWAKAADDIEKQIAEAKAKLGELYTESRLLRDKAADLEKQTAGLQNKIQVLEKQRKQNKAASDPRAVAGGAAIEVRISGDRGVVLWPYWVREYSEGKPIGTLACDNSEVLRVTLSRIAKDPNSPKELRIVIDFDAPYARVKAVLEACKAAGFKNAVITGDVTQLRLVKPPASYATEPRFDLDDLLQKLGLIEKIDVRC